MAAGHVRRFAPLYAQYKNIASLPMDGKTSRKGVEMQNRNKHNRQIDCGGVAYIVSAFFCFQNGRDTLKYKKKLIK